MSELDDFLTPTLTRQLEAEQALINGDPGPRLAMWSTQEPVTVFGAEKTVIGSEEARQAFRWLATRFSDLTDYRFELVAPAPAGTWPTPLATNTSPSPWTAARSNRLLCASPTTAERTASGKSSTDTPTPSWPIRPRPRDARAGGRTAKGSQSTASRTTLHPDLSRLNASGQPTLAAAETDLADFLAGAAASGRNRVGLAPA